MAGYAALVWTDNEVIQLSYVGALDETYRPDVLVRARRTPPQVRRSSTPPQRPP